MGQVGLLAGEVRAFAGSFRGTFSGDLDCEGSDWYHSSSPLDVLSGWWPKAKSILKVI